MIRLKLQNNTEQTVELLDEIIENDTILKIDYIVFSGDCWAHI